MPSPPGAAAATEDAEAAAEVTQDPLAEVLPSIAEVIPEALRPAWELISHVPLVAALVVALVFFAIALVARFVVVRGLLSLTGLTMTARDDRAAHALRKPIFTSFFMLGLVFAAQVAALPFGEALVVNAFLSVIVASWIRASLRVSSALLEGMEGSERFTLIEARTVPLFDLTVKLLSILFGSYVLLMIWGINPVGWLASAGIVGIAVGFAAKDTLANLFSGFFIVADAPYKLGDYINLDTGERGMVTAIGLRSTRLLTRDDVEVTVPNGVIANAKIVNESGGPAENVRVKVPVGVAYGSDVDLVCDILQRTGEAHGETCERPEPRVRMRQFGPSSLDFELLVWITAPEHRGRIRHELFLEIYRAFLREGVEIPFAQQDVYIKEMPGRTSD